MKRFLTVLIFVCSVAVDGFATTTEKRSYDVQQFKFSGQPSVNSQSELKLIVKSFIASKTIITLQLPDGISFDTKDKSINSAAASEIVSENEVVTKTWNLLIAKEGDYLIQIFEEQGGRSHSRFEEPHWHGFLWIRR